MPSFSMVLYISPSKFAIFLVHGLRSMSSVILVDCVWVFISKKKLKCLCSYYELERRRFGSCPRCQNIVQNLMLICFRRLWLFLRDTTFGWMFLVLGKKQDHERQYEYWIKLRFQLIFRPKLLLQFLTVSQLILKCSGIKFRIRWTHNLR